MRPGIWVRTFCGASFTALLLLGWASSLSNNKSYTNWSDYAGSADNMQYSALKQVNKGNVDQLEMVWSYAAPGPAGRFAFNPLVVDGVMYLNGKGDSVVALDAATGKQIWSHPTEGQPTNRGFNYWQSKDGSDGRLIYSANSYLQEINVQTGVTIPSFGDDGRVNLREGLDRDPKTIKEIQSGTPGRVFENLIILGSAPGESFGSPPGHLRAYDVITGKLMWTFHTIPHPGEFGYDTWPPDAWKYVGGANTWGEISLDEKRGIIYFPLGAPTYDFYGGDRIGANLFGDSLVALDARTGKRLWHFQMIHHDLWDYDPTTAPKLMTVRHNGKMVDIVAQPTKFGFVYAFNRVTGEPLWPIEERPVPQSDVPGEKSWPTQPFPTKPPPFARQTFTADDIDPYISPEERAHYREVIQSARNFGLFTPPSEKQSTIVIPGDGGGANWGSTAGDPDTGVIYIKSANAPDLQHLALRPPTRTFAGGTPEQQGHFLFSQQCEMCHGADRGGVANPKEVGIARFKEIVTKGEAQMPAFTDLSAAELDALAAYISNPAAGELPPAARNAAQQADPLPPPPPGQVRYFGRYNNLMFASNKLPVIGPPWTTLTAIDLNEGTIKWQTPLGEAPELAGRGITNTGAPRATPGGPVATAGGLIFIGSGQDQTIRAFDKDTGKVLWEKKVGGSPKGMPAVYEVGGREYIAFLTTPPLRGNSDLQAYNVFALPVAQSRGGFTGASVSKRSPDQNLVRTSAVNLLGWRSGVRTDSFGPLTFVEAVGKADAAGAAFVEGVSTQQVSSEIRKPLDDHLTATELETVKGRLNELRLRMPAYRVTSMPADGGSRRKSLEFARSLGVETVICSPDLGSLPQLDKLANELGINVAVVSRNPKKGLAGLEGLSKRIGVSAEFGTWKNAGITPVDAVTQFKGRLLAADVSGLSGGDLQQFLLALSRSEPPKAPLDYPPPPGHDGGGRRAEVTPVFFQLGAGAEFSSAAANYDAAVVPAMAYRVDAVSRLTPISTPERVPAEQKERIEKAIPREALATPKRPRKLLVLDLAVNGAFYHGSAPLGNLSLELMAKYTGAFTPVFSNDLDNLKYPKIKEYDGIFLNQIQGDVFADPQVIEGLTRYVREGGGVVGLHAATWASQNVPQYGDMMGATSGAHKYNGEPGALRVDDPNSPITRQFGGQPFEFFDEFYHYIPAGPYSRQKVHVLLSLDPARKDLSGNQYTNRPDNDYGMVWIKSYGKGRVFNVGLGHRPEFYENPKMQHMVLAGVQFILGDLEADTTPGIKPASE